MTTPGHRYELHRTNTHDTDELGHRYKWCVYDYFDVNGQNGLSFWYFATKQDALRQYPEEKETAPTLTKRLNWRTTKDQFFQSFGCGQTHTIKFMGACESCNRSVYSHGCIGAKPCSDRIESPPDPRGIIPVEHCYYVYQAEEYNLKGRDVVVCYDCSQDGDKYHAVIARAKSSGAWTRPEVIGYLCGECGKSGPEHGHYDVTDPNTHKFVCGEEVTR